jgi:hypothetical protein
MFRNHPSPSILSPRMSTLSRTIAWLALTSLGLLSACATPSGGSASADSSTPARVTFRDYQEGTKFELVNEAHTDPSTKVANNEVISALLDYLSDSGFESQARSGAAPRTSSAWQYSGEIETTAGTVFLAVNSSTPADQRKMFLDCYMNHVQLWSNVFQLQRVDAGPGEVFKKPGTKR